VPILPIRELTDFVKSRNIHVGVLAVPEAAAQQVFDLMASAGILGVLNFTPVRFRDAGPVVVNHVNLEIELENVLYFVHAMTHAESRTSVDSRTSAESRTSHNLSGDRA